jgi:RND superfamily putative drug exporter
MAGSLYRIGRSAVARPWRVIVAFLLALLATIGAALAFPGSFASGDSIPGSPAQVALERLQTHFPPQTGATATVVYQAPDGEVLTAGPQQAAMAGAIADITAVDGVSQVDDPAARTSADGRTAAVEVVFTTPAEESVPVGTLASVEDTATSFEANGGEVLFGGEAYAESHPPVGPMEAVGVGVALLVLVLTLGSLLAAGLPLVTALLGVVLTSAGLFAVANLVDIAENALTLSVMLGLAVGIDYALFIVSRHRRQLAQGMTVRESVPRAVATAGSAVVFAGATVVIALVGLLVAGVPMLSQMGLASAAAVAVAVLWSVVALPAVLALAGERLRPRPGGRIARREAAVEAGAGNAPHTMGMRWIGAVVRHPGKVITAVVLGLSVMTLPVLQLQLALTDDGSQATSTSTRQTYDAMSEAFGPGVNGPLVVLVEGPDAPAVQAAGEQVRTTVEGLDGVAGASPVVMAADQQAAVVQVAPATGPRAPETADLVVALREATVPIADASGTDVAVTGVTAVGIDLADQLNAALVPFTLVVVGLALLLLMIAFRSWTIPLTATAGFLLSVGAAFGATVAVFQWGWLAAALAVPSLGPIASFVPIIVMAVLFGLAMDYQVFLVSSIRERYTQTGDAREAITEGSRGAARVVTAAALIMIAVFAGFMASGDPNIMPIAFALSVGVFIDAFLIRMTFVPAVLALLGDRAWTLPRWLDRSIPAVDVEGHDLQVTDDPHDAPDLPTGTTRELVTK